MNAFYCGLDVHKESTYATVLDSMGQVVTQKRMKNEEIPRFLEPLNVERIERAQIMLKLVTWRLIPLECIHSCL